MKKLILLIAVVIVFALATPVLAGKPAPIGEVLLEYEMTFLANTPFHIRHGWREGEHPDVSAKYELEWNGQIQKFDIFDVQRDPDTGLWTWVWIYNFPEGLTGTQTFTHHWYGRCEEFFEDCENNSIVEVNQQTQTVTFINP